MSATDKIDTRIEMNLHPNNVRAIEGYEEFQSLLTPAEGAFRDAYEGIRQVWETRAVVERNRGWNEDQKLIQLSKFAEKKMEQITAGFDRVMKTLDKQIAHHDAELNVQIEEKSGSAFAAEIRAHAKGLSTDERMKFMERAVKEGDEVTMGAILGAPGYLSGTTPELGKIYLRRFRERMDPVRAKKLAVLRAAKAHIESNAGLVFKDIEKAMGGSSSRVKTLNDLQAAAEKALQA